MIPTVDEIEKMHDYVAGAALFSAIHTATKLKIADFLQHEALGIEELALHLQSHPDSLARLMRALTSIGVFKENLEEKKYALTPMGSLMLTDSPFSLSNLILMWGSEWHFDLWKGLENSVKTCRPYFVEKFGMEFFIYLQQNPLAAEQFHAAMSSLSSLSNQAVANKIDFSKTNTVVDIGGGQGGLLAAILEKWPAVNGVLFDIESAIEKARHLFSEKPWFPRCQLVAGDFFKAVPNGADLYIVKHVLHGLDNAQSTALLKKIKESAQISSRIFIIEMVKPEANTKCYSQINDLEMMLFSATGKERELADFHTIFQNAGLSLFKMDYLQMGLYIMEVH